MPKVKYGFAYLTNFCDENKITLLEDYSDIFVTRDTKIKYQCIYENCSKEYEKSLRDLLLLGGYCRSCIVLLGHIKRGKTNMEKYGCKVSLSNKEVQEKSKATKSNGLKNLAENNPDVEKSLTDIFKAFND